MTIHCKMSLCMLFVVTFLIVLKVMLLYLHTTLIVATIDAISKETLLLLQNKTTLNDDELHYFHAANVMSNVRQLQLESPLRVEIGNRFSRSTWKYDQNSIITNVPPIGYNRLPHLTIAESRGFKNESNAMLICFEEKSIHVSDHSKPFFNYMANGAILGSCSHDDNVSYVSSVIAETMGAYVPHPASALVYPQCVPTVGKCVRTFNELQTIVTKTLKDGDTIAICDSAAIEATSAINIRQNNITLCCESGPYQCLIVSTGTDTTIVVFGDSFTIRGMIVTGGATEMYNGGNLGIEGFYVGNYVIDQCSFSSGSTLEAGGNVFIGSVNSVVISNSIFVNGYSGKAGGNIAVQGAANVTVSNSLIYAGISAIGGGITLTHVENVMMYNNNVTENIATEISGGIDIANPFGKVTVVGNQLINNYADRSGGGLTVTYYSTPIIPASVTANLGVNNGAQDCPDVAVSSLATELACLSFSKADKVPVPRPIALTPVVRKPIAMAPVQKPIVIAPIRKPIAMAPIRKPIAAPKVTPIPAPVRKPIIIPLPKPIARPVRKPVLKPPAPVRKPIRTPMRTPRRSPIAKPVL